MQDLMVSPSIDEYLVSPEELGRAKRLEDAQGRYLEFVKTAFPKGRV